MHKEEYLKVDGNGYSVHYEKMRRQFLESTPKFMKENIWFGNIP